MEKILSVVFCISSYAISFLKRIGKMLFSLDIGALVGFAIGWCGHATKS